MNSPLFSVITITLNNISGLQKTYQSVHNQTCADYEWIVIDGQSNDGTLKFLKQHCTNYISEADEGLYDAMNKGIECAKGTYLIFMNAGDIFTSKETLQTIGQSIKAQTPDFIHGDALEILNGKEVYKKSRLDYRIMDGMITHHQSMFYRRERLGNLRYNLKYKIAADYDLTYRFIKQCDKISYVPTPICLFESGGISESNALQGRIEQFKIRRKLEASLWFNIFVFAAQTALHTLRRLSPKLYWWLKYFATRV